MTMEHVLSAAADQSPPSPGAHPVPLAAPRRRRKLSLRWSAWLSLTFLVLLGLAALLAPWLPIKEPNDQELTKRFAQWSMAFPLGSDALGRDVLSRLIYGARTSLGIAVAVVGIASIIALPLGMSAGYRRGKFDGIVMRVVDAMLSVPSLVAVLAIAVALGPGAQTTIVALTFVQIPTITRLVRNQSLAVANETFIEAATTAGLPMRKILRRHVFPNIRSPLLIAVTFWLAAAILAEAGLGFLGVGVQPPAASWGAMIRLGVDQSLFTRPSQIVVPGTVLALTIICLSLVTEGLRDALGGSRERSSRVGFKRGLTLVRRRRGSDLSLAADRLPESTETGAPASALLSVRGLTVAFGRGAAAKPVLENLDFDIGAGEVVGLVGESGSGKTVTALSILRLLPSPPGSILGGSVLWKGRDLLDYNFEDMRQVRGAEIAMVFQDPMTSLDPSFTIGSQIMSACRAHRRMSRADARRRAVELLQMVEIPDAARRLRDHPHQLSGGMRQRVMIAIALSGNPQLLIADEATTALDVTVQAEILDLLRRLRDELQMTLLVVSHDLEVIREMCTRVIVMYAGQIVASAPVGDFFARPKHPYAEGLLRANPHLNSEVERLYMIPGAVPVAGEMLVGCRFAPRCAYATAACGDAPVELTGDGDGAVRCIRAADLELQGLQ